MTTLSVVIVHYKVKDYLFACLASIKKYWPKFSTEVIVVDNDETKTIESELKKRFPWVIYAKSPKNLGFGAGNNIGARIAKGKYLFSLNPDTRLISYAIDYLVDFLTRHKDVGIVAPLLLDPVNKPYSLQGTQKLGFWESFFALSFLNSFFPKNSISKRYWNLDWDKTTDKEVDVIPGTAFVIRKELFEKIGGFDERFFLYFEEYDLCSRVKIQGYSLFILPKARVIHAWGASTKSLKKNDYFIKSRFIYFRKHIGFLPALFLHVFLSIRPLLLRKKIYLYFERLIRKLFLLHVFF